MSKLGYNLVMDVTSGNRNPGTQVISYNKISPPKLSQLWMKKQFDDDTFYLVSKLSKHGSSCMIKIQVSVVLVEGLCVCLFVFDS